MRTMWAGNLLAVLFLCLNSLAAQDREGMQQKSPEMYYAAGKGMIDELGLSAEQREKLKELRDKNKDMRDKQRDLRFAKQTVSELMRDPESSESEITQKVEQLTQLQTELTKRRMQRLIELRKVLSADQMRTLVDKVEQKKQARQHRRHGGEGQDGYENARPPFMGGDGGAQGEGQHGRPFVPGQRLREFMNGEGRGMGGPRDMQQGFRGGGREGSGRPMRSFGAGGDEKPYGGGGRR